MPSPGLAPQVVARLQVAIDVYDTSELSATRRLARYGLRVLEADL